MIIDMHAHLHTNVRGRVGDGDTLRRNLERGLVDRIALSSLLGGFRPTMEQLREGHEQVAALMREHSASVMGFCTVNPLLGRRSLDEFRRCIEEQGMVGMKWWVAARASDPCAEPFFRLAADYRVPVLVHAWAKATGNEPGESVPEDVRVAAMRFPETNFIMAHRGGDWQYGKKAVRGVENIYVDISGPHEMGIIEDMVDDVGAHRLVFGTDNVDVSRCAAMIRAAQISDAEKSQIFAGTALGLLPPPRCMA
jgi:predicted TIM-barrel fold metal-dependent hydrolase